ncbi:MAG TPA: decarboxylating 6-phosphogluconate dehydrogenase [Nitrospirota bacterium]|nr:decarboxylating 6-phosphogluconate dehydrogenase [Nitrospirota bacterium]
MKLGYVGLGKMGYNMVERLLELGHQIVAYNKEDEPVQKIAKKGAIPADSLRSLAMALEPPRLVWVMVPYEAVDAVLKDLTPLLAKDDTVIDGGNSPYKESLRRAHELGDKGINFLDVGVSGGPAGARNGACIMVGGDEDVFRTYEQIFRDASVDHGYAHFGKSGAGHFVKMVHNGIEYGMMQALAEGFAILRHSGFNLDLEKVADLYNHRSVIESRLVGWLKAAYEKYGEDLEGISGAVAQSGEATWTIDAAKELGSPVPIIKGALDFRLQSQSNPSYIGQIVSALRNQFGGHEVKASAEEVEKRGKRKIA